MLEELVPPLELCKQLKPGEFEDSAMVWATNIAIDNTLDLRERAEYYGWDVLAPAPTLEEILDKLRPGHWCLCAIDRWYRSEAGTSAVTAALRLYLEVRHDWM